MKTYSIHELSAHAKEKAFSDHRAKYGGIDESLNILKEEEAATWLFEILGAEFDKEGNRL